jgi:hypothetical protein
LLSSEYITDEMMLYGGKCACKTCFLTTLPSILKAAALIFVLKMIPNFIVLNLIRVKQFTIN